VPVYFIHQADIRGGKIEIGPPLFHHLVHVLRYQKGDGVTLVDEARKKYGGRITSVSSCSLVLDLLWEKKQETTQPNLHLGIALIKGNRIDWVIEKATELGIARISPLYTKRVVVKPRADRSDHQQKRWREIAKEAAQQSERWEIPVIDLPVSLDLFLEQTQAYDLKLICWEAEAASSSMPRMLGNIDGLALKNGAILIGPEGGWTLEEVDRAREYGYCSISLGDRPLRADTAAISALSILQNKLSNVPQG